VEDGQRVHETLIENAQHQVHGEECREDEQRLIAECVWNALAVPWKVPRTVMGAPSRAKPLLMAWVACDSDTPAAG